MDLTQFIIFIDTNLESFWLLFLQSVCMNKWANYTTFIPLGKHRFVLYFPICVYAVLKEGGRKSKEKRKGGEEEKFQAQLQIF